jgi:hypothetical protein
VAGLIGLAFLADESSPHRHEAGGGGFIGLAFLADESCPHQHKAGGGGVDWLGVLGRGVMFPPARGRWWRG